MDKNTISRFSSLRVLVLGDFMLDHFLWGKVERISPEAPVPIVDVDRETFHSGGAGNVAMNLRALGASVIPLGVVGDDPAGARIRQLLAENGMASDHLLHANRPTTVKTRIIAHQQQVVRVDREERNYIPDGLMSELASILLTELPRADAVVISDYSKGCISSTLLAAILPAVKKAGKPVCVDPKPRHFPYYSPVTMLTPNQSEAAALLGYPIASEADLREAGRRLLEKIECDGLLITRGEKGMVLFTDNQMTLVPTRAREVYDVTGAGDTVVSTLTLALAAGASMLDAVHLANAAAGIVVGKVGTATVSAEELLTTLKQPQSHQDTK